MLQRASNSLAVFIAWIGSAALVVMMTITFVDVVGRTIFGRALTGSVEAITLLMGVVVFSGLAKTQLDGRHVVVDIILQLLSARTRRFFEVASLVIAVGIGLTLDWLLLQTAVSEFNEGESTQIWHIPYWPAAIFMVVGLSAYTLALIASIATACGSSSTITSNSNHVE